MSNFWEKAEKAPRQIKNEIKCACGHSTGLDANGFLMAIPDEGLKCPKCGKIILRGPQHTL